MSSTARDTRDGLVVGLLAYASVAAFYAIFDVLATRGTLYTVNLLGRAVMRGLRDPGVLQYPVALDVPAILAYNAVHLVLSLLIGVVVLHLVGHAERHPGRARMMLGTIVGGFVVTIVAVGVLSAPIRAVLPWWSIVVANSVAVVVGARYVVRRRPDVMGRLGIGSSPMRPVAPPV